MFLVVSDPHVNRAEAIRRFDMLLVIPVYQTFWIMSGTLSGLIYFNEIQEIADDSTKATMFFVGTAMALGAPPSMTHTRSLRTKLECGVAMFHLVLPVPRCAVIVTIGGIFALTREHAQVEMKRSGMSLQTDEEDSLLVDPVGGRSDGSGPSSPLIVGPAGLRQSISEYKAAVQQQAGCVRASSEPAAVQFLRSVEHAAAAAYLELGRVESILLLTPRCSLSVSFSPGVSPFLFFSGTT
jgi:hypothetical protein